MNQNRTKNHHNPRLNTRSRVMWSYVARKKGQSNYRVKKRGKNGKKKVSSQRTCFRVISARFPPKHRLNLHGHVSLLRVTLQCRVSRGHITTKERKDKREKIKCENRRTPCVSQIWICLGIEELCRHRSVPLLRGQMERGVTLITQHPNTPPSSAQSPAMTQGKDKPITKHRHALQHSNSL